MARESSSSVSIPEFHRMLVLARWALGIFNEASFETISAMLKASTLEGLNDEDDEHWWRRCIAQAAAMVRPASRKRKRGR